MHVIVVEPELRRVITDADDETQWHRRLETAVPGYSFEYLDRREQLSARIADADIVAGFVTPEALEHAIPQLRWVHSWAAGPNRQLYPAFVESRLPLTCCKGNGAIPLAEHAMMLMLMLQRDVSRWAEAQRQHRWDRRPHGELSGLTCGILGVGHSGKDLALKAKAFHMRTWGLGRTKRQLPNFDRMFDRQELRSFLGELDFLVVTAPLTEETRGMLGASEFAAMKRGAYYVCFSRGGIADDTALLDALHSGQLAGAGLDAHSEEPLPKDSPFWDAPNTIVTPHNGSTTKGTHLRGLEMFIDNLQRYRSGDDLLNLVDLEHGY